MADSTSEQVRAFLEERLRLRGDQAPFSDEDSLFVSGRLDSLDAMQAILYLEETYGVDFSQLDFSIELIDSVHNLSALAEG